MHFASYVRKSVYSDKSDSVANQERMCREYVEMRFPNQIESFDVYQDEGFTGANTNRPDLQRLMEDIEAGFVDALVVYQLDRLSRDVRDFSNIYSVLEEKRVMFISLKESIDTTTPIGKAMMYVTMVFAQMERETIVNRVTDNFNGLVKKGLWPLGGIPFGYQRKYIELNGKKHCTLEINPEKAACLKGIFEDFLSSKTSIVALENRYRKEGKQAPGFLYDILTSPYCCAATPEVYDYWEAQGCQMDPGSPRELWDGSRAVMVYGKRPGSSKRKLVPRSEWKVCLALHPPIIPGDQWLAVQDKFKKNTFDKKKKFEVPLLSHTVRCAKCGCLMKIGRKKTKNGVYSSYVCAKRACRGVEACDMKQVGCKLLDNEALAIFHKIEADPDIVRQYAARPAPSEAVPDISVIQKRITAQEAKIARLTTSLGDAGESSAARYIVAEIERQDLNLQALKRELELAKRDAKRAAAQEQSLEEKAREIGNLAKQFDSLSDEERNAVVQEVVKECTWDGETLFIRL